MSYLCDNHFNHNNQTQQHKKTLPAFCILRNNHPRWRVGIRREPGRKSTGWTDAAKDETIIVSTTRR